MANFALKSQGSYTVTMTLTEGEARALEAILGYGQEEFVRVFYKYMGEVHLKPHESGLKMLFGSRSSLVHELSKIEAATKVIEGKAKTVLNSDQR